MLEYKEYGKHHVEDQMLPQSELAHQETAGSTVHSPMSLPVMPQPSATPHLSATFHPSATSHPDQKGNLVPLIAKPSETDRLTNPSQAGDTQMTGRCYSLRTAMTKPPELY